MAVLTARNPRTGVEDYRVALPTADELASLTTRLRDGQRTWASAGLDVRTAAMLRWVDALAAHRDAIVSVLVEDTGRIYESYIEFDAVVGSIRRWCELLPELIAPETRRPSSAPWIDLEQTWEPYQLVGVVSPWNIPLLLSLIDAIPALLAGCAVIVKPSEITPRFIEPMTKAIDEVPELAAVLAYVPGGPETGAGIVELVDAICFTGSVATGRKVAAAAAARLIPAYLELGGKDPAIVLEGADVDHATTSLLWGSVANAGQSCLSIERIYVAQSMFGQVVEGLISKADALELAYPHPSDGVIGPIIAERQIGVIRDHINDAVSKGARVRTGGDFEHLGGGAYLRPTVLTRVDHSMRVMTEETFGPVMPVMPFASPDEAVELANATEYGLSAAVFGREDEAAAVARRIAAGAVSVNDAGLTAVLYDGEKNAFGNSGLGGTRMGPASVRRFLRRRAFYLKQTSDPDPWWFPSSTGSRSAS